MKSEPRGFLQFLWLPCYNWLGLVENHCLTFLKKLFQVELFSIVGLFCSIVVSLKVDVTKIKKSRTRSQNFDLAYSVSVASLRYVIK